MCVDPWSHDGPACDGTCGQLQAQPVDGTEQKFAQIPCATTDLRAPDAVDSDVSEAARCANTTTASNPHSTTPRQAGMSVPTADMADTVDPIIQRARLRAVAVEQLIVARQEFEKAARLRQYMAYTAHFHGVTFREIAEAFDVSESTARTLARSWEDSL